MPEENVNLSDLKRWLVKISYINGYKPDVFEVDEIEELQEVVEGGPDFALIEKIEVFYNLGNV